MSKADKPSIRIDTDGGAYIEGTVYVGGDFFGRDKITVFDATVTRWLALGASNLLSWLRLLGTAVLLGLLVTLVAYQLVGSGGSDRSLALAIIHGALGAALGGLVAWYSPTLPAALLRVAWIEGGLFAAELVLLLLFPASPSSVPTWFGLPVLHASMLVAFVAGPWLALVTFILVRVMHIDRHSPANRQWRSETLTIVVGCLSAGLLALGLFSWWLDQLPPPADPSKPIQYWSSARISIRSATRFDTHQDGFIILPGWLSLGQAVAILVSLAMIVPTSAALSMRPPSTRLKASGPAFVGLVASAVMGMGLEIASVVTNPEQAAMLRAQGSLIMAGAGPGGIVVSALVWGAFGMVSGLVASILRQLLGRT